MKEVPAWLKERVNRIMSFSISAETIAQIQFETNYETYEKVLLKMDRHRFRGLGYDHTRSFVRHATQFCDQIDLNYKNEIA